MNFCVIGAGAAGLAAARHLAAAGIPFEVIEREHDVGGIWDVSLPHSPVYLSTHLISSKPLTQFPDFPMPREYPDYPDHAQALAYLRAYARRFELYQHIRFGQTVERAERIAPGEWRMTLRDGTTRSYAGLIVAAGVHWVPATPRLPGAFEGISMHSCGYKSPEIFRGRRVLVVGAGNSGCDIAVEAGRHAERAFLSVRRGYHYIPKYAFGRPIDQVGEVGHRLRLPLAVRRRLNGLVLRTAVGRPEDYGLPRPDHRLLESHPIVNSEILPAIRRGEVRPKPDLVELRGDEAVFKDGTSEAVDLIVYATGYRVTFPFLDSEHLNSADGRPDFYLHTFHPTYDDLFILGMLQPDSAVWPLMDLQARAVAVYIRGVRTPERGVGEFRELKRGPRPDLGGGLRYLPSERHRYEVEHASYARRMREVIRLVSLPRGLPVSWRG
jgi:Flavin-binding monooxygenase-like